MDDGVLCCEGRQTSVGLTTNKRTTTNSPTHTRDRQSQHSNVQSHGLDAISPWQAQKRSRVAHLQLRTTHNTALQGAMLLADWTPRGLSRTPPTHRSHHSRAMVSKEDISSLCMWLVSETRSFAGGGVCGHARQMRARLRVEAYGCVHRSGSEEEISDRCRGRG